MPWTDILMVLGIGLAVFALLGVLVFAKEFYRFKTNGKIWLRVLNKYDEEEHYLVKADGMLTEPTPKGRSYAVKPKQKLTKVKEKVVDKEGNEVEHQYYIVDPKGNEYAGSCHNAWYPPGLFRSMQVKVPCMDTNEGDPNAINRYGKQEAINITDKQLATIKKEQFAAVVMEASKDVNDVFDKLKGLRTGFNKWVIYLGIPAILLAVAAVGYLVWNGFENIWG